MLRAASVEDIPYIINILKGIKDESPRYKDMASDVVHVHDQLQFLIQYEYGIMLVDDEYRGVMLGCVSSPWFSPRLEGCEYMLAVAKEHRGGMLAARLIKAFVNQCGILGATRVHAGSTVGINDPLVRALYRRLGFKDFGAGLVKEL